MATVAMEVAVVASIGWMITTFGWFASPVATRLLNHGIDDMLSRRLSEKLQRLVADLLDNFKLVWARVEAIPAQHKYCVANWTNKVRSALLDAEDILGVARYRQIQKQKVGPPSIFKQISLIFSGESGELKKFLKELEKIVKEGPRIFNLLPKTIKVKTTATTSSPHSKFIVGRVEEFAKIITMLIREAPGDCPTIGIHGITKSGTTFLAQHVCIDDRTKDHFSPIMWINISQFNEKEVYKQMLEAATREEPGRRLDFGNHDTLERMLKAELRGKRFLLVLDGLQNSVAPEDEEKLHQLLDTGKKGSKILVTACSRRVVKSLRATDKSTIKLLPDLSENDAFDLLMCSAFGPDVQPPETLRTIGREIAKTSRSPFVAYHVGKLLQDKLDAQHWSRIQYENPCANDLKNHLWKSYQQLDGQVKLCFAYFGVFPRQYRFNCDALVKLWMAEGFIEDKDKCKDCFDDLVSRSFIQSRGGECFTIHDMLHELAEEVLGSDCLRVLGNETKDFPSDVRRLFITSSNAIKFKAKICKLKKLRTLIITSNNDISGISVKAFEDMLKKLKNLRVVQVYLDGSTVMIPKPVRSLKLLRFLSIMGSTLKVVKLPEKFHKLYNLQILNWPSSCVLDCSSIKDMNEKLSELPESIRSCSNDRKNDEWYEFLEKVMKRNGSRGIMKTNKGYEEITENETTSLLSQADRKSK